MIFELWANTERTEWTFLESRGSESARGRLKMDDHQLVWSVEASSYNEAMASYHRYDLRLYLGADRKGDLLEVVAINRRELSELVIHAMPMRSKYRHLIPGE